MLSLSQLSPSRSGGGYGRLAWYKSRRANLETHLGSRWLRLTSSGLAVVTIGVVLRWWRWASIWSEVVVDLLVQWVTGFLGGGSPIVDCDLRVVCELSGGYGRL
uniref:Uncharacterized protein n=1 Tax=Fagus sylvatica TaxID=28930 RepID=A0A2N9J8Q0_FAGSY